MANGVSTKMPVLSVQSHPAYRSFCTLSCAISRNRWFVTSALSMGKELRAEDPPLIPGANDSGGAARGHDVVAEQRHSP
jgi:hypothetical protein